MWWWRLMMTMHRDDDNRDHNDRAVFKWLSKVITWLRLLRLVIGLKDSRQFFNQWEAKPKPIAPCTRDFSRALSKFQIISRNCDWFIALFAPVVIGRSNCFGFGFSTVIWKPLYDDNNYDDEDDNYDTANTLSSNLKSYIHLVFKVRHRDVLEVEKNLVTNQGAVSWKTR